MNRLYTVQEVSEILSVGYRKVLDLIALGKLGAYRIGTNYRIAPHDLNNYLESCKFKSYWQKASK